MGRSIQLHRCVLHVNVRRQTPVARTGGRGAVSMVRMGPPLLPIEGPAEMAPLRTMGLVVPVPRGAGRVVAIPSIRTATATDAVAVWSRACAFALAFAFAVHHVYLCRNGERE